MAWGDIIENKTASRKFLNKLMNSCSDYQPSNHNKNTSPNTSKMVKCSSSGFCSEEISAQKNNFDYKNLKISKLIRKKNFTTKFQHGEQTFR